MGRRTHEVYGGVWPGRDGDDPELINKITKYVVSGTPRDPSWSNTTVIADPLAGVAP